MQLLKGMKQHIAADGEILIKGGSVFEGYFKVIHGILYPASPHPLSIEED
jgi:hypothetical protein